MANKVIDIKNDIIVSREWLDDFIKKSNNIDGYDSWQAVALKKVIENSIPAKNLAAISYDAGVKMDARFYSVKKDEFLNSKIEIDG